jgi:IclR family acetate operon transcriptional repressor
LESVSRDIITRLAELMGESVNVAALDHGLPVYIAQADGARSMRMVTRVGQAVPLHSTAVGKAILAFLPDDKRTQLLSEGPYPAVTKSTITQPERLSADLRETRSRGFAVEREEHEEGVASVAAPVLGVGGQVVGAINVSAPIGRAPRAVLLEWGPTIVEHAATISERLGGAQPYQIATASAARA